MNVVEDPRGRLQAMAASFFLFPFCFFFPFPQTLICQALMKTQKIDICYFGCLALLHPSGNMASNFLWGIAFLHGQATLALGPGGHVTRA